MSDAASAPTRFYAGMEPPAQASKPSTAPPVSTHEWRQLQEQAERARALHEHWSAELGRVVERIARELKFAALQACRHTTGNVLYNFETKAPRGLGVLRIEAEANLAGAAAAVAHYTAELSTVGMVDAAKRAAAEDAEAERVRAEDAEAARVKFAVDQEAERKRVIERATKEREDRKREAFRPTTMPG